MPDSSFKNEKIPQELTGVPIKGKVLLRRFMKDNMLFGGGSTYAARASILKKIDIPVTVDMFTDEFLIQTLLPFGKTYFIPDCLSVWRSHGYNYSSNSPKNVQVTKAKRLLSSSDALLDYLTKNGYDKELTDIYKLKNLTAHIAFKELTNTKSFRDIAVYAREIFFTIRPGVHVIKQYHVLNRLIPTSLFRIIKNAFKKRSPSSLHSA